MGAVYTQLSITERRRIERWRHAKVPVDEMARVLKRCRSTIFRELKRNFFSDECMPKCDGYYGAAAHLMQAERRARDRKLIKYPELCKRVIERIKEGWTPEQIGNRMIHERAKLRVCQETIYRYIYSKEGMREDLWWYLPTHRIARRPRRTSPLVSAIRTASLRNSSVRFSPIVNLLCCSKCYQRSGIKPRQVQIERIKDGWTSEQIGNRSIRRRAKKTRLPENFAT